MASKIQAFGGLRRRRQARDGWLLNVPEQEEGSLSSNGARCRCDELPTPESKLSATRATEECRRAYLLAVACNVIQKAFQRNGAARPASQPAVQANGHHLGAAS